MLTRFQALQYCRYIEDEQGHPRNAIDLLVGEQLEFLWCSFDAILKGDDDSASPERLADYKKSLEDTKKLAKFFLSISRRLEEYSDDIAKALTELKIEEEE